MWLALCAGRKIVNMREPFAMVRAVPAWRLV
jgi:hypothetical protein